MLGIKQIILDRINKIIKIKKISESCLKNSPLHAPNRKIYLYDNGFASATHFFSEDRGKLLENLVFTRLRASAKIFIF